MGRPSIDREPIIPRIIQGLTEGKSLRTICKADGMPHYQRVFEWLAEDPVFADQYARAREADGSLTGEQISEIAWAVLRGEIDPQAARVALDALKWAASHKDPKVYGDHVGVEHKILQLVAFADMGERKERMMEELGREEETHMPHLEAPDGADESPGGE